MLARDIINAFAYACAIEEEFFANKRFETIPQRLNNPIGLPSWSDRDGSPFPQRLETNCRVEFPACEIHNCQHEDHPAEVGWRAGRTQCKISLVKRGLTFLQVFSSGKLAKENPRIYAQRVRDHVARKLGLGPEVDINTAVISLAEDQNA